MRGFFRDAHRGRHDDHHGRHNPFRNPFDRGGNPFERANNPFARGGRSEGRGFGHGGLRLVLLKLLSEKPSHGYELIKAIEERFKGGYSPSPGVIYPTLNWLEDEGFIRGYQAVLDLARFGLSTTVLVRVTLESQNEDALNSFEAAVVDCPSVVRCFLMSGSDDYIVIVMARDIEDFERIHRTELSRLPRVARIQSSFAMREVVNRAVPPVIFAASRRRGRT